MKRLTISYLDHFLHFCEASDKESVAVPAEFLVHDDSSLEECFDLLRQGHSVWVWGQHGIRHLFQYLKAHYIFVKAAGGLAEAPDGDLLVISRQGMCDIPKGMVEKGETLKAAAVREVCEETGLHNLSINYLIVKTYHIYDKYGGWHIKQTSWYMMRTTEKETPTPQKEEGITHAQWTPRSKCKQCLLLSYASLRLVSEQL